MKSIFLTLALLVSFSTSTYSQLYKTTWGVRVDDSQFGLNLTQKLAQKITVEGFIDFDQTELRYGGNLRFHRPILGRRLSWYPGVGAFGGLLKPKTNFWGASFLVGADYKFMMFPLVISFDVNPIVYISTSHPEYWSMQTVFSLKYVLVKEPTKKKRWFKKNDPIWE